MVKGCPILRSYEAASTNLRQNHRIVCSIQLCPHVPRREGGATTRTATHRTTSKHESPVLHPPLTLLDGVPRELCGAWRNLPFRCAGHFCNTLKRVWYTASTSMSSNICQGVGELGTMGGAVCADTVINCKHLVGRFWGQPSLACLQRDLHAR